MGLSRNVGPFAAYLPPSGDDLHQPAGPALGQLRTRTHRSAENRRVVADLPSAAVNSLSKSGMVSVIGNGEEA